MQPAVEDMTSAEEDSAAAEVPEAGHHSPETVEDPADMQAVAEHTEAVEAQLRKAPRTQHRKGMADGAAQEAGQRRLGSS